MLDIIAKDVENNEDDILRLLEVLAPSRGLRDKVTLSEQQVIQLLRATRAIKKSDLNPIDVQEYLITLTQTSLISLHALYDKTKTLNSRVAELEDKIQSLKKS